MLFIAKRTRHHYHPKKDVINTAERQNRYMTQSSRRETVSSHGTVKNDWLVYVVTSFDHHLCSEEVRH